jgi:cell division protein FtsQ
LVHLGSSDYLDRFKIYVAHLREWRHQFQKLESVDLRYDRQIIVNPDMRGVERQPALSKAAVRVAMSAGVKPAALVTHEPVKSQAPPVTVTKPVSKLASKPPQKTRWHKRWAPAKHAAPKPKPRATVAPSVSKSPSVPQKPSPAIAKGQGTQ